VAALKIKNVALRTKKRQCIQPGVSPHHSTRETIPSSALFCCTTYCLVSLNFSLYCGMFALFGSGHYLLKLWYYYETIELGTSIMAACFWWPFLPHSEAIFHTANIDPRILLFSSMDSIHLCVCIVKGIREPGYTLGTIKSLRCLLCFTLLLLCSFKHGLGRAKGHPERTYRKLCGYQLRLGVRSVLKVTIMFRQLTT